ncbi:MAG TPA: DMT family transporter [Streptosporangiaceae bacterium]|jgi:drug/metabolite transporter (DMT)-like permease
MSSLALPPSGTARSNWQLQYLTLALIWGMSFLFIKEGVRAFAPLQITLGRVATGAAVLMVVLLVRRERLPRGRGIWGHLVVVAVINNVIPFSLFGYAEQRIPSALAGICNASAPLFGALVAFAMLPDERLSPRRVAGLATGFAGVFVALGAWTGLAGHDLPGALMALGGGLCYSIGFPYTRRFLTGTGNSSLSLASGQLLCSTVILAFMAPALTTAPTRWPATSVLCIVLLGALGTGIAYLLNYGIIAAAGATIATTVGYVMPLVSILAGIALLGERLTWNEPVGAAVIVAGAALVQARTRGPRSNGFAGRVTEQRRSVPAAEGLAGVRAREEAG